MSQNADTAVALNPLFPDWPSGTVTFLYTDVKGSTVMAANLHDVQYQSRKDEFRKRLREQTKKHRGRVFSDKGDGIIGVFPSVREAVLGAVAVQKSLQDQDTRIPDHKGGRLQMRMGIHRSKDELNLPGTQGMDANADDPDEPKHPDYGTEDLNYASRIEGIADADQILLSESAAQDFRGNGTDDEPTAAKGEDLRLFAHLPQVLKDLPGGHVVYDLLYDKRPAKDPGYHFMPLGYAGEINRFIARTDQADKIFSYFDEKAPMGFKWRIVVLRGAGGAGKTRLASYCAARMTRNFPGGVSFVGLSVNPDLQPIPQPADEIARRIATVLTLPPAAHTQEGVIAWANGLTKPALLLLDNAESVAGRDEAERKSVNRFLGEITKAQMCRLLITSRKRIVPGKATQTVDMNEGMTEEQARELFVSVARQEVENYAIRDEAAFARICIETNRIPIALTLAANSAYKRGLDKIADGLHAAKLGEYARRPQGDEGDLDDEETFERHISVRASIDWSFGLLTGEEKATLPLCGLFDAPFLCEVVTAVAKEDCTDALDGLQNASLILFDTDTARYSLHNSVREYARDKFDARPDADECRARFVSYYTELFAKHKDSTEPSVNQQLILEWPNLVAANDTSISLRGGKAMMRVLDIQFFVVGHGFLADWKKMHERTLDFCESELSLADKAGLRFDIGVACKNMPTGDRGQNIEDAIAQYEEAADLYARAGQMESAALSKSNMASAISERFKGSVIQNQREARKIYRQAEKLITQEKYPDRWARLQISISLTYRREREKNPAANMKAEIRHLEAARAAISANSEKLLYAHILKNLGGCYRDLESGSSAQDIRKAITCQREAVEIYKSAGYMDDWAKAQVNLGCAYIAMAELLQSSERQKYLDDALTCFMQAIQVHTEVKYPHSWAMARENIGDALYKMSKNEEAYQNWCEALRGYKKVNHTRDFKELADAMVQKGFSPPDVWQN